MLLTVKRKRLRQIIKSRHPATGRIEEWLYKKAQDRSLSLIRSFHKGKHPFYRFCRSRPLNTATGALTSTLSLPANHRKNNCFIIILLVQYTQFFGCQGYYIGICRIVSVVALRRLVYQIVLRPGVAFIKTDAEC